MILGLQIIALVFTLIMVYFTYLHYRRNEVNGIEALFLFVSWIGAILIVLFPNIFSTFSNAVAISRPFDLAVIGGVMFVIPLVYSSYVRTKRLEKRIEQYVREEALKSVTSRKNIK